MIRHETVPATTRPPPSPMRTIFQGGMSSFLSSFVLHVVVTKDLKRSNDIWVCLNPDYVCTRFFFVYDTSYTCTANTSDSHFKKEIGHAMEYIKAVKAVT